MVVRKIINHDAFTKRCPFLGANQYYPLEEIYHMLSEAKPDKNKSIYLNLDPSGSIKALFHFVKEIEISETIDDYTCFTELEYYFFSVVID